MRRSTILTRALALVIGVPLLLALSAAATIYALDRSSGSIVSSGRERSYLLHVPPSYDPGKPAALVISLHGAALFPAVQRYLSAWDRLADEQGFLVVYPAASGFPPIWHVDRSPGRATDVRFIADLIDALQARYRIDPARIYVNGMSNGGGMAFVLSCTLSDRIAAIGMVSAAQSLAWDWCTDARPVPMIDFHGTADPVVPYDGGPSPAARNAVFPSVRGWAAAWAQRNHCAPEGVEATLAADATRLVYAHCAADASVELDTVLGGGHTWPGGRATPGWLVGPTSTDLDATRRMWTFFQQHPLAGR
jgi:polyhydroxybutyrate depolymerase